MDRWLGFADAKLLRVREWDESALSAAQGTQRFWGSVEVVITLTQPKEE